MVALPQLLDIITGFGQDSTFTLARLGALHRAVWDDFGQLYNPVVDLVPAAALHCGGKGKDRVTRQPSPPQLQFPYFRLFLASHLDATYLRYVEPSASHLELSWEPLTS